jgi:L-lactate dehydrogenase complex protein LldG
VNPDSKNNLNPVLKKLRQTLAARESKAAYPDWSSEVVVSQGKLTHGSLQECFENNFDAVHGITMHSIEEVRRHLTTANISHGYCDPALADQMKAGLGDGITLSTEYDRALYDSYQFGITRGTAAIAESGTIVLRDSETSCRLGALTPWVHIALVDHSSFYRTIADAIDALGDDPNVIWVTGPSKTADVEGILIEGVHGPGEQIALILE